MARTVRERLDKALGRRWMALLYIAIGLLMTGLMTGLTKADVGPLHAANYTSLEGMFRFRLEHYGTVKPAPITLIVFDGDTQTALGLNASVPPRDYQARLTRMLTADGAKVIGFDVAFLRPKPEDTVFSQAVRANGHVVLQEHFGSPTDIFDVGVRELHLPPDSLLNAAAALGYNNRPQPDDDGVTRRGSMATYNLHGVRFDSWPAAVARSYLGYLPQDLQASNSFLINFVDEAGADFHVIRYENFFKVDTAHGQPPPPPSLIKNRIVLIGSADPFSHDQVVTPLSRDLRFGIDYMANAISTIINDNPIVPVDGDTQTLLVFLTGLLTILLAGPLSIRSGASIATVLIVAWVVFVHYMFVVHNVWLNVTAPALTVPAVYLTILAVRYFVEEREKRRIRSIFSHYVSPQVVNRLVQQGANLAGERKEVTVLFSDIRNFTTLSESLEALQVVWFLNQYFERMAEIVFRHEGTLDKYVGDAVMVLWNAPDDVKDGPRKACQAALEMQQAVEELRPIFGTISQHHLAIGIGINVGQAVVGTLGSGRKREYTAIGDTVNVAARLEGLTKDFGTGICISGEMVRHLPADAEIREQGAVHVKGRGEPVKVYSLHALHGASRAATPVADGVAATASA